MRAAEGWAVVRFEGAEELIDDSEAAALGAELQRLVGRGGRGLVVNVAGVRYASSSWLAQLVCLYKKVNEAGFGLRLCA
ncbi:MAG: STAS domain-containing protein [Isosphaeraceae bacterium]